VSRLPVQKTSKLFIGGAFPRSESGRTYEVDGHNIARASRKDARDAVRAARAAVAKWSGATAYNRGQVLYRLGEMMETRSAGLADACSGEAEVERSIDRVVWYAGWADKLAQVLGGANPVAGPYFNFTMPEPTGVVAILAPPEPALEGLVSRLLPALVGGNTVVVATGDPAELAPVLAAHMDVNAIDVTGAAADWVTELERLAAENVKRVVRGTATGQSVWEIEPLTEAKTVWHPMGV
jgi:acyl-CoA reductase-like NAD-dependent aldehyde dehydrogenase